MRPASILIIARAGPVREGLRALLSSLPDVAAVHCVASIAAAVRLARRRRPAVICLEAAWLGPALTIGLERLAHHAPRAARVLLVEDVAQQQAAADADSAGLLLGAPPQAVVRLIEAALAEARLDAP